ncbi:MAG: hypothetical protein ACXWVR_08470, partial [Rhodoplanes sp.]
VQNDLVELYNLLTLLKPGIFKTLKEFRAAYMTPGKPRQPANAERLREMPASVSNVERRASVSRDWTKTSFFSASLRRSLPADLVLAFGLKRNRFDRVQMRPRSARCSA